MVVQSLVEMSDALFKIFILLIVFIAVFGQDNLPQSDECGKLNTDYFYNQKNLTEIGEFPWMAKVQNSSFFSCDSVLISKLFVLSSPHCMSTIPDPVSVLLGDWNKNNSYKVSDCDDSGRCAPVPRRYKIEKIIIHPNFSSEKLNNDFALVKLSEPVTYSDYIRPICLPNKDIVHMNFNNQLLELTGWYFNYTSDTILAKSFVRVVNYNSCELKLGKLYTVDKEKTICAFGCFGKNIFNSGSALMGTTYVDEEPANYYLIGISVLRQVACPTSYPSIYVRIDGYLDWIYENTDNEEHNMITPRRGSR